MSKHEIQNVCRLTALLALHDVEPIPGEVAAQQFNMCGRYAADAMRLQKLGRRALRWAEKQCNIPDYNPAPEEERIMSQAGDLLNGYAPGLQVRLSGDPRGYCLHIIGLPGNTLGGDEDGFGI